MFLSDYNYDLPEGLIARYPTVERRGSRLLVVDCQLDQLINRRFSDLASYLRPGDLLVFNDTKVIRARLNGRKETGGRIEALLERVTGTYTGLVHIRASKAPKPGTQLLFPNHCTAVVLDRKDDLFDLEFSEPLGTYLELNGDVPLPPYLNRAAEPVDVERYQTIYAQESGAVAAPTAGLHFDADMLAETKRSGVRHCFVTLHVGAGTFQSLRAEQVESNKLHSERVEVSPSACAAIARTRQESGRIIAVGTTSVRALEAATQDGEVRPWRGETDLFIQPGYRFKSVDALLTNFHLPQSSLLMLVAALAGRDRVLRAYRHAVDNEYRFFSYGDAMLILPEPQNA